MDPNYELLFTIIEGEAGRCQTLVELAHTPALIGFKSTSYYSKLLRKIYFISEAKVANVFDAFEGWLKSQSDPFSKVSLRDGFELFLEINKVQPLKYASFQIGIAQSTLSKILEHLIDNRKITESQLYPYGTGCDLVNYKIIINLASYFEDTRRYTFSNHSQRAISIVQAYRSETKTDYKYLKEFVLCKTGKIIDEITGADKNPEHDHMISAGVESIRGEPLGLPYGVPIKLGKSIRFRPDHISLIDYWRIKKIKKFDEIDNYLWITPLGDEYGIEQYLRKTLKGD